MCLGSRTNSNIRSNFLYSYFCFIKFIATHTFSLFPRSLLPTYPTTFPPMDSNPPTFPESPTLTYYSPLKRCQVTSPLSTIPVSVVLTPRVPSCPGPRVSPVLSVHPVLFPSGVVQYIPVLPTPFLDLKYDLRYTSVTVQNPLGILDSDNTRFVIRPIPHNFGVLTRSVWRLRSLTLTGSGGHDTRLRIVVRSRSRGGRSLNGTVTVSYRPYDSDLVRTLRPLRRRSLKPRF